VAGRFEQYAQHVPHLVIVVDDSHDARIISIHADDFPATATRPANGTLIAPSRATTWSGTVTLREPVGMVSVPGAPNSPPPAASQIDTTTVSPIPIFGSGGFPYFQNRVRKVSFGCDSSVVTTWLLMSTTSNRGLPSLTDWSTT
jgi:hypothetical protein